MTVMASRWWTRKEARQWRMLQVSLLMYSAEIASWITCENPTSASRLHLIPNAQIGEISLMKEMTSVATTMMTDEEKADIERELKGKGASPAVTPSASAPEVKVDPTKDAPTPPTAPHDPKEEHGAEAPPHSVLTLPNANSPTPSASSKEKESDLKDRRRKPTPEQKQKLEALDKERREAMEKRVKDLHQKLIERYGSFY